MLDEQVYSLSRTTHVRNLSYAQSLVLDQLTSVSLVQLILGSAWQGYIYFLFPRFLAGIEGRAREFVCVRSYDIISGITQFQHIVDLLAGDTHRIIDISVRTGDSNHFSAQLGGLCSGTPSHVAETGDGDRLVLDIDSVSLQHLMYEIKSAEAGSFRTKDRTSELHALTRERTRILASQFLVHTVHITYLTATYAYIASRNIPVRTKITP